jgi:hypothetical protein
MKMQKEQLEKQINTYKRMTDTESFQNYTYTIIIFFTLIAYILFGILPLTRTLLAKADTVKELETLNSKLYQKKEALSQLELDILESEKYLSSLVKAVERDTYVERFMVSYIDTISRSGFKQTSMNVNPGKENNVEIRSRVQGAASQFVPLIKGIEQMQRLVVIKGFSFNIKEADASANLNMEIFYLK